MTFLSIHIYINYIQFFSFNQDLFDDKTKDVLSKYTKQKRIFYAILLNLCPKSSALLTNCVNLTIIYLVLNSGKR